MHILQVTLGFYPANAWGGPIEVIHQNGKELVRRGHQVTVYCTNLLSKRKKMGKKTTETIIDGMRIVYFNTIRFRSWPGTLGPFWMPDLPSYMKRDIGRFDIVHLNGYRTFFTSYVARMAKRAGIPVVTQPHGTLPVIISSYFIKRLYDRFFGRKELKGISALIALQETERRQAQAHGVPIDRIEMIPNGIDPAKYNTDVRPGDFKRRYGLDLNIPIILFVGRINKIKGPDMLVEAFAKMRRVNAKLVIAGPDDGQLRHIQNAIAKYSLEAKVLLPGLLNKKDVISALKDAGLFVLPSRSDAFPFAVLEACLMGTPMIVTDRCQIAELLRDRIAEVVPFDADALAHAMETLLLDKERREQFRLNSGEVLREHFSIRAVVDKLESVYEKVRIEKERVTASC